MEFEKLLRLMVEKGGSDLFITAGVPPSMKVNGKIMPVTKVPMSPEQTRETVHSVMNEQQRREFAENHECNFAISARGIGRFRVSAFQRGIDRDGGQVNAGEVLDTQCFEAFDAEECQQRAHRHDGP